MVEGHALPAALLRGLKAAEHDLQAGAFGMSGTLYGLGLGPGDPELITLKSWRIISMTPVIAWPRGESGRSRARAIAAPFIPEDVEELPLSIPFTGDAQVLEAAWQKAAEQVAARLDEDKDVAFLCLGDPLTWGSFARLAAQLAASYPVHAVPGVVSAQAAAARFATPLVQGDEPLKLLPATMDREALLTECMNRQAALAILKAGRRLDVVREVLAAAGRLDNAMVVQALDGGEERIMPLTQAVEELPENYFSLVLVWPRGRAPRAES